MEGGGWASLFLENARGVFETLLVGGKRARKIKFKSFLSLFLVCQQDKLPSLLGQQSVFERLWQTVILFVVFQGQAFVNGFNLGRYWPVVGPQVTLYVPASTLLPGKENSELVLLELDNAPCISPQDCFVEFLETPDISGPVSPMAREKIMTGDVELHEDWTSKYRDFLPWYAKTKQETIDLLKAWP